MNSRLLAARSGDVAADRDQVVDDALRRLAVGVAHQRGVHARLLQDAPRGGDRHLSGRRGVERAVTPGVREPGHGRELGEQVGLLAGRDDDVEGEAARGPR